MIDNKNSRDPDDVKIFKGRFAAFFSVLGIAVCLACLFSLVDREMIITRMDISGRNVGLRDFPYPYGAMAALINDCDNTTPRSFERYHRFLNTRGETIYGPGLGLDISDSVFMYTAAADYNQVMTYFLGAGDGELKDARRIERYIRCGWIDALHSYGDFSSSGGASPEGPQPGEAAQEAAQPGGASYLFTRELAAGAAGALRRDGIFPLIWTDHGNEGNVQNFGSYGIESSARYKRGDSPYSRDYYHSDITLAGGLKYIWNAKDSSRFGYGFPLTARTLRDGRKLWSFSRYTGGGGSNGSGGGDDADNSRNSNNGSGGGDGAGNNSISTGAGGRGGAAGRERDGRDWYPDRLRYILTEERLSDLADKGQYGLFAQHLGYYGEDYVYEAEDVEALRLLADFQYGRNAVLVAGTARLFEYATARKFVSYKASLAENTFTDIDILSVDDPLFPEPAPSLDRLRGLTFYCDDQDNVRMFIRGEPVDDSEIVRNAPDETGRPSVSIRWHTQDTTDYTQYG